MAVFYSTLRTGFKALPEPLKARILSVSNSLIWRLRSAPNLLGNAKLRLTSIRKRVASAAGRFRCSVCDRRVARFDPLPATLLDEGRKYGFKYSIDEAEMCNAAGYSCPHCGAADRERLYALYLRDYFRDFAPTGVARLVDFAPSAALSSFIRKLITQSSPKCSYRTADLLREDVDDQVDIMEMKIYENNSVDFFVCSHVLEHVTDDKKALRELHRILRVGGRGILVVPIVLTAAEIDEDPSLTDPAERWRRFGQDDHVRLYSKEGFLSRVHEAGLRVQQLGSSHFGLGTFRKHGITSQSVLYIVEKP